MNYELFALEKIVSELVDTKNRKEWKERVELVKKEIERIQSVFLQELFADKSESVTSKYVQLHQRSLIKLLNQLYTYGKQTEIKIILDEIEKVLFFLEEHFREQFSMHLPVPQSIKEKEIERISGEVVSFSKKLFGLKIPDSLIAIVLEPFGTFIEQKTETFYYQLYFIRALENLVNTIDDAGEEILDKNKFLFEGLCLINFNSVAFYYYCKDTVYGTVFQQDSEDKVLYKLNRFHDYFSQLILKPNCCYNPYRAPITTLVAAWVDKIIKQRNSRIDEQLEELKWLRDEEVQRTKTSMTVGELALITRLLTDTGAFTVDNKKSLAAFMVRYFVIYRKPFTEESSAEYFYNSMSTITQANIASVKSMFKRMSAGLEKIEIAVAGKNTANLS